MLLALPVRKRRPQESRFLIIIAMALAMVSLMGGVAYGFGASWDDATTEADVEATVLSADVTAAPPPVDSDGSRPRSETTGSPAIRPTLPENGNQPTYTEADAIAYAEEYPPLFGGPTIAVVDRAVFITAAEAADVLNGADVPRPADTLVCMVFLSGEFGVSSPSGAQGMGTAATMIFDAITGNLLVESVE